MMTYQQSAGATWRAAKWLPRLIFCCRDLPDILKFARVAARSVAPTACFYGPAGSSLPARRGDVVTEMGLVSAEQAMIEAQFASMLCADLSLACAVDVSREAGIAWAGPGATHAQLMQSCREQQMTPCFAGASLPDDDRDSLLGMLRVDPTPLLRLQKVSLHGTIRWLPLSGAAEAVTLLGAGAPDVGIISRLELRLRPAAVSLGWSPVLSLRQDNSCR
ncbi:MAG: hypothetical protein CMP81_11380 [Fulvimarina sp.]|nr:hypothetical protein [Fulvimarina sp.]